MSTDDMSQERYRRLEKMTLCRLQLQTVRTKSFKYQGQVVQCITEE